MNYDDAVIELYRIKAEIQSNNERIKQIDTELEFFKHIKFMVEKQMARGIPEKKAFENVKKMLTIIDEIVPKPPKDPLQ